MRREKVTFLCRQDFANVSTEIAHALRTCSERYDARVISMGAHPFDYALPHDWDLLTITPEAMKVATQFFVESQTIVWAEEANDFGDAFSAYGGKSFVAALLEAGGNKRRFTFHAGIAYRGGSAHYNPCDQKYFDGQLCSPDLLRLANPGAGAIFAKPMTTDLEAVDALWKKRRAAGKVVITHSPSNHATKGTAMIRRVMAKVQQRCTNVVYRELGGPQGGHVPHDELMRQRDEAVIHIDQYHPHIGGAGISAYEAMARGAIPAASMNLTCDEAYAQWGLTRESFPVAPLDFEGQRSCDDKKTEKALVRILSNLGSLPFATLEERGRAAAQWVHDHLAPAAYARTWEAQLDLATAQRSAA